MIQADLVGSRNTDGIKSIREPRQEFVIGNLRKLSKTCTSRKDNDTGRDAVGGRLEDPDKGFAAAAAAAAALGSFSCSRCLAMWKE